LNGRRGRDRLCAVRASQLSIHIVCACAPCGTPVVLGGSINIIIKNRGPGCSARGQTRGVSAGGSAIALKALSESPHHLAHLAAPGTAPGAKWQRRRPEQQLQALSLRRATSLPAAPDNGHRMPERRWSRREQLKTKSKFGARASLLPVPKFVRLCQLADLTAAKQI